MSIPVEVMLRFSENLPETVSPSDVLTDELRFRMGCLLTGRFETEADGRCVIYPDDGMGATFPAIADAKDSVCVGVDLGPISVSYCKDID